MTSRRLYDSRRPPLSSLRSSHASERVLPGGCATILQTGNVQVVQKTENPLRLAGAGGDRPDFGPQEGFREAFGGTIRTSTACEGRQFYEHNAGLARYDVATIRSIERLHLSQS